MSIKLKTLGLIAGAVTAASATMGQAEDLAGKTVEFVIPFSESGGSARWANFYAPLLSEALPGRGGAGPVRVELRPAINKLNNCKLMS